MTAAYGGLTAGQRRVVDCLLNDPLLGALWGIETLAERAQVSVTTVIRVARYFGFEGFADFRQTLKEACRNLSTPPTRGIQLPSGAPDSRGLLAEVARRDATNTQTLLQEVDQHLLAEAVRRLANAHQRLALGRGPAQIMCEMLAYQIAQAGLFCMVGSPADYSTQVENLTPKDLLVVVSLTPYNRETLNAATAAREAGVPVLAFTDRRESPLARLADTMVLVPCENLLYTHSFATFAVLSHAIATALAAQDRQGTLRRIKAWDRYSRTMFMDDREVSPEGQN
ncbi:MAG: MurR/RpiR family transcriptional regulator [Holophaga sp.]|nr:MurR/RpiR family transcriptional regulator [Holophaga sp.]